MTPYYQTTLLTGEDRTKYEAQAQDQEHKILRYFLATPWTLETAESLLGIPGLLAPGTPITSVRRALSNLEDQGQIEKVGQETGQYGRPITKYALRRL